MTKQLAIARAKRKLVRHGRASGLGLDQNRPVAHQSPDLLHNPTAPDHPKIGRVADGRRDVRGDMVRGLVPRNKGAKRSDAPANGRSSADDQRELEGVSSSGHSPILSHRSDVLGGSARSGRNEAAATTERTVPRRAQSSGVAVSVLTLKGQHHIVLAYNVPANGRVRFEVESETPTNTIVLDGQGLALFKAGQPYVPFGGLPMLQQHRQELTLPFQGTWFLVILNPLPTSTAVHFN